jgi:hypothetical protein
MNNRERERERESERETHTYTQHCAHTLPHPPTHPHMWRLCALRSDPYLHLIWFLINNL